VIEVSLTRLAAAKDGTKQIGFSQISFIVNQTLDISNVIEQPKLPPFLLDVFAEDVFDLPPQHPFGPITEIARES